MPISQMNLKPKATRYPYIYAHARSMGSYPYYIEQMLDKAIATNAPEEAIYEYDDGTWRTIYDIRNPMVLRHLKPFVSTSLAQHLEVLANKREVLNAEEALQKQIAYLVDFIDFIEENADEKEIFTTKERLAEAFLGIWREKE